MPLRPTLLVALLAILLPSHALQLSAAARGGTVVTLIVDSFDCPEKERLKEHTQLPEMLEGSLSDVFNNSQYLQVTFIEPGKFASILRAAKGYQTSVPVEKANQIAEKTKADYVISVSYHQLDKDSYRMGGRILKLKDGRIYAFKWVKYLPHSEDPFHDLAFRLKQGIYKIEGIPVSESRFSLTVCGPELSGAGNSDVLSQIRNQIGNTLLTRFSSPQLTNIATVDPTIRDCSGSANPNELRVSATFIYESDPATGRRRVHYFVQIRHKVRGVTASDDRICDEEQLFATLQDVVGKIREMWEQSVVGWDETGVPVNAGDQR